MPEPGSSRPNDSKPQLIVATVVLVWRRPGSTVDRDWFGRLGTNPGLPIHTAGFDAPGARRLTATSPAAALVELAGMQPESDIVLLRAGLEPPGNWPAVLATLAGQPDRPPVIAFPGSHDRRLDPLAGLDGSSVDLGSLVGWSAERCWQPIGHAGPDCLLVRAGTDMTEVLDGPAALLDDGYVIDPAAGSQARPDSEDLGPEPVHGHLKLRVHSLMEEGIESLVGSEAGPVTLHIAHSWGGGVWRWIDDFIEGDGYGVNLVLVANSDGPGRVCGRSLTLCAAGPGRGVVRELALAPAIESTVDSHAGYRAQVQQIVRRFGVSRIIVSSLIGHSLDVLRLGRPTLQVLHDFHPMWPLLDRDPMPFLDAANGKADAARAAAVGQHGGRMRLQPTTSAFWNALAARWLETTRAENVSLIAPTRHVRERWQRLAEDTGLEIGIVPHGFRPFAADGPPVNADQEAPLHLVIPGRLTEGKGLALFEQALPELRKYARFTALGCGRDAHRLFGQSGVNLVLGYQRDDLPALLAALRPHAALFLSTVPETWNYTLSEIRALGVPPVATRLGSFIERIADGEDGLLFDPTPDALVEQVRQLVDRRHELGPMARRAAAERSLERVVMDVAARVEPSRAPALAYSEGTPALADWSRTSGQLAEALARADRAEWQRSSAAQELERRTRWAETMERQFRDRSRWAESLDAERIRLEGTVESLEEARHELSDQRDQLSIERDQLEQVLEATYASRSWRITRPLRVASRLLSPERLRRLANPLKWPGMARGFLHHWRLRGLKQALWMLQTVPVESPAPESIGPTDRPRADRILDPVRRAAPAQPIVSIVVPVYNQLHFTAACLHSLVSAQTDVAFEIVVVDDASSDATARWLKRCKGIRVLRNAENLGFIGTCNRGAAAATGDYLVFLNNDTEVRHGWLDALLDVFRVRPDAGVVGGRLVYADGTLQEAGGIVLADGNGWNYGRGDSPGKPQYGFVSQCDYVSGACLAVRRKLFAELDGFDRRYAPAYYEDTDLCFRVRALGLRVYYQPAATVVHFEGVTSGTDETTGVKRYQVVNREKFVQRWRSQLVSQPANEPDHDRSDPARHLRYHRFAQRALVIDAVTPMPDHDSGSVRMVALLKLLTEMGYQTSFLPSNHAWSGSHSEALQQDGIEVLFAPWVEDIEDWLAEHGDALDLVVVSRHYVLEPLYKLIRARCPNARLVFDTVDLHFLREDREADLAGTAAARREAARTRRQELELIGKCDSTLVVSTYEQELLTELAPGADVHVVSNIHALNDPGRPFEQRRDLVFVGGFQHPPNLDAAEWLIDEILPLIRAELPDVQLHLIGSKMPDALARRQAPGLQVHGFVSDLLPFMTGCRVSVAPLRYGAGVKGKVNQAMSHGLPVVATTCAAEGMFTLHGHDILMADTAAGFAAEVARLYRDRQLWEKIAVNSRENVREHFSIEAARTALVRMLQARESTT